MKRSTKTNAAPITAPATWQALLIDAVNTPGTISSAYSAFHNYSLGNQLLALFQCRARDIQVGPIATFKAWTAKNRSVRKGEKAIVLCQPISFARTETDAKTGEETKKSGVFFKYSPRWFVVAQTDGEDAVAPSLPEWDATRALAALDITQVAYTKADGNTQGYAFDRNIAVSVVATNPLKTTAHELAHVLLGHTSEGAAMDGADLPRNLREVEAESVALIVVEALGMPGASDARGYVQHWLQGSNEIPETSAARIFKVADRILKAGRPVAAVETVEDAAE